MASASNDEPEVTSCLKRLVLACNQHFHIPTAQTMIRNQLKNALNFVESQTGFDLVSKFEDVDHKTIAISAIAITSVATVGYIIKKQYYDYYKNIKPPSDEIAKFVLTAKTYKCKNGSIIEYQEYGDINGFPILCFHGSGMDHLEGCLYNKFALNNKIRLIYVSRPGCGNSTFPTNLISKINKSGLKDLPLIYPLSEYFNDIKQLLNYLNIENNKYGILGASLGGLYGISGLYYNLKPSIIISIVGVPIITKNDIKTGEYNNVISNNLMPLIKSPNSIINNISLYMIKIFSQYYPNLLINAMMGSHISPNNELGESKINLSKKDIINGYRLNDLVYFMAHACINGINGHIYGAQLVGGQCGVDFDGIDNKLKNECKIFMFMGKYDEFNNYDFYIKYYNNLINKYNFKNVEIKVYNSGHIMHYNTLKDLWDIIGDYVKNM